MYFKFYAHFFPICSQENRNENPTFFKNFNILKNSPSPSHLQEITQLITFNIMNTIKRYESLLEKNGR